MLIKPVNKIKETIIIPGDKSISHRAIMLSSLAEGESNIYNFLMGDDCLNTIECFRSLGVPIIIEDHKITIQGVGLNGLKEANKVLDVGNSGTTIRLMSGILSGQRFSSEITGDSSIQSRPMNRITIPLREMGASISGSHAPLRIQGNQLNGITYNMPVSSAQVKSAILLAGLFSEDTIYINELEKSRDHTERMINFMGGNVLVDGLSIISKPIKKLYPKEIYLPGDISSAAFFLVLGAISKDGDILIKDVGINPTRTGILDVLIKMGANIKIINEKVLSGEPVADLHITSSTLTGIEIGGEIIPRLIDEIPIIAVAAALAKGTTIIKNAEELKVKESNRIEAMVTELKKIGADIEETHDGMIIHGKDSLIGGKVESYDDHRIAMALAIAGLVSEKGVFINKLSCVNISFPSFLNILDRMMKNGD